MLALFIVMIGSVIQSAASNRALSDRELFRRQQRKGIGALTLDREVLLQRRIAHAFEPVTSDVDSARALAHSELFVHMVLLDRPQIPVILIDSKDMIPQPRALRHARIASRDEFIIGICEVRIGLVGGFPLAPTSSVGLERQTAKLGAQSLHARVRGVARERVRHERRSILPHPHAPVFSLAVPPAVHEEIGDRQALPLVRAMHLDQSVLVVLAACEDCGRRVVGTGAWP